MPSVDVHLQLTEVLHQAAMQNSLAWILCDLLVVMRAMCHEQNAFKWSQERGISALRMLLPVSHNEEQMFRDDIIRRVENILQDLESDLVKVSRVGKMS